MKILAILCIVLIEIGGRGANGSQIRRESPSPLKSPIATDRGMATE